MNDDRKNTSKNVNKFIQKLYTKIKSEAACTVCAEKNVRTDVQGGGAEREKERGRKRPQSLEQNKFTFSENVFSAGATFAAATKATAITHTPTHTHKHTLAHVARGRVREREREDKRKSVCGKCKVHLTGERPQKRHSQVKEKPRENQNLDPSAAGVKEANRDRQSKRQRQKERERERVA